MLISVVNHTKGKVADEVVQEGVRAVNRQIAHDFEPYWHMSAELRLEGAVGAVPDDENLPELRGDAILYLWDSADVEDALGFHDAHARGVPFGFVFTEIAAQLNEPWTATLSHEALELIADPEVNLLVSGPHPAHPNKEVFHWYEMCDAVQDETYEVDGVTVSNFLLPLYFTSNAEKGGRNDFLGRLHNGKPLRSFGINPGGYIGFYNPETREHETFALRGDARARKRLAIKGQARLARRSMRYKTGLDYGEKLDSMLEETALKRETTQRDATLRRARRARVPCDAEKIDSSPERRSD